MITPRVGLGQNKDNTDRMILNDYQAPAYAASIAIATGVGVANTLIQPAQLTGNLSLTIGVGSATTDPQVGDTVKFIFTSDASIRVITFSTGFASAGTLSTVASKKAYAEFVFDGTAWVEMGRAIGA